MSIVDASDEPGATRAGKPVGTKADDSHRSGFRAAMQDPMAGSADGRLWDAKLRDGSNIDRLVLDGPLAASPLDVSNACPAGKQTHDAMRPELTISNSSETIHAAIAAFFAVYS